MGDIVRPKEPWHIRYYAGDRIPAAVLAYEKPKPAPHPTPHQEDEMQVLRRAENPKHSVVIIDGVWYMSADGGIRSPNEIVLDVSAWHGIVDANRSKIKKV